MGIKYGNNIDLGQNQMLNAALENSPTHLLKPVLGQAYYNTELQTVFICIDAVGQVWLDLGDSGAEFPEGVNGQILENDSTFPKGVKWSDRLTDAEIEIDAEIVNRAIADNALQEQITTNANSITTKLDKPTSLERNTDFVVLGDSTTIPKRNFTRTEQVEVAGTVTAQESWKGKLIIVTSNCTITIPSTLSDFWGCEILTFAGATLNWAITSPHTWLFGTPSSVGEKSILTIAKRGSTNSIILLM